VIILLPPSEGKTPAATGPRLDLDALSLPELTGARAEVLDALAVARDEALRRADALAHLTELLADGTVDGRLTAMMDPVDPEGH